MSPQGCSLDARLCRPEDAGHWMAWKVDTEFFLASEDQTGDKDLGATASREKQVALFMCSLP
jgi:hypothetical protein